MAGLLPELVGIVPEQCRECRPFELIVRILGNMVASGNLNLEDAQQVIAKVADPACAGPPPEAHACSKPACAHKNGDMYLVGVNRTINIEGPEAL